MILKTCFSPLRRALLPVIAGLGLFAAGAPAAAQTASLPGVGSVEVAGGDWRFIGGNSYLKAFVTDRAWLERRQESGVYVLVVWKDPAMVANGRSAELSAYGYDCGDQTVVQFSPTNLDWEGAPIPRDGGSPPAIVHAPDGWIERNVLKSACGEVTYTQTTRDPMHF